MEDVFSDQFGLIDFQRSQHGSGMSGRSQVTVMCDSDLTCKEEKALHDRQNFIGCQLLLTSGVQIPGWVLEEI